MYFLVLFHVLKLDIFFSIKETFSVKSFYAYQKLISENAQPRYSWAFSDVYFTIN